MPQISMFNGIVIYMYWDDHNPPHIHAKYHDYEATFKLNGDLMTGELPKKERRIVEAWIELRKEELEANWEIAGRKGDLFPIDPIR